MAAARSPSSAASVPPHRAMKLRDSSRFVASHRNANFLDCDCYVDFRQSRFAHSRTAAGVTGLTARLARRQLHGQIAHGRALRLADLDRQAGALCSVSSTSSLLRVAPPIMWMRSSLRPSIFSRFAVAEA